LVGYLCLPYVGRHIQKKKMTKELLIKFLNNKCTDAELEEVIRWANTEAFNKESINNVLQDWKSYHPENNLGDDIKFTSLFDKVQQKIKSEGLTKFKSRKKPSTLLIITTWITRAAAIILLPVLAFLFYTLSEKKTESNKYAEFAVDSLEIVAPIGSRTVVQLTDGSEVHLNYGSKLKYPQVFSGKTREVILTGEGYFDVAHNPEKPFIVKTDELNIKALGTSFNVQAYPELDIIETTLVDGKLLLEKSGVNGKTKPAGAMEPGQHVNYNINNGKVSATKGNIEKYIAWKDGKVVFECASVGQVSDRLSRMFNVDIEVKDNIRNYTYTVTFVDEPLFQILDLMTIATPVKYEALPRKKLPDGTFTKQQIIISRRS
jgi:transmembrane sensor